MSDTASGGGGGGGGASGGGLQDNGGGTRRVSGPFSPGLSSAATSPSEYTPSEVSKARRGIIEFASAKV